MQRKRQHKGQSKGAANIGSQRPGDAGRIPCSPPRCRLGADATLPEFMADCYVADGHCAKSDHVVHSSAPALQALTAGHHAATSRWPCPTACAACFSPQRCAAALNAAARTPLQDSPTAHAGCLPDQMAAWQAFTAQRKLRSKGGRYGGDN